MSDLNFPLVEIVLATYNGERWLDQMMRSLYEQDYINWSLIVRDDGSNDKTRNILSAWKIHIGPRMRVLENENNVNVGISKNFEILLRETTAQYVMLADNDDIWHRNKISLSLTAIRRREAEVGSERAILVHTDMTIIDGQNQFVAPSGWTYADIRPSRNISLKRLIFGNVVTGATVIMNQSLIRLALPIPPTVTYHDWWLALVAAAFGEIEPIFEKTMDYRRHERNASDLTKIETSIRFVALLRTLITPSSMKGRLYELLDYPRPTVDAFLQRYRLLILPQQTLALEAFCQLRSLSPLQRRIAVVRHNLWFNSIVVNVGYLLLL